jgi:hypothetical protein
MDISEMMGEVPFVIKLGGKRGKVKNILKLHTQIVIGEENEGVC